MAENKNKIKLESALFAGFIVTLFLSFILISVFSSGKDTLYSAYVEDESKNLQWRQLNLMASDLEESTPRYLDLGYNVANTMSTPMLVNDWKEPHRTMLLIVAPEKPITITEADAVYDFVTKKGGKVIIASNNSNAQVVADKFGVQYKDAYGGLLDGENFYSVKKLSNGEMSKNKDQQNIWALASVQKEVQEDVPASFVVTSFDSSGKLIQKTTPLNAADPLTYEAEKLFGLDLNNDDVLGRNVQEFDRDAFTTANDIEVFDDGSDNKTLLIDKNSGEILFSDLSDPSLQKLLTYYDGSSFVPASTQTAIDIEQALSLIHI